MDAIFIETIKGKIIKQFRDRQSKKTKELAKLAYISSTSLNMIETGKRNVQDDELKWILKALKLNDNYFYFYYHIFEPNVFKFIEYAINMDDELLQETYDKIQVMGMEYQDSYFGLATIFCEFVWGVKKFQNNLEHLISILYRDIDYFSETFKCLFHIFLGTYYKDQRYPYEMIDREFNKAKGCTCNHPDINALLHYYMSAFYYNQDVIKSMQYSQIALQSFTLSQNYRRILNTAILSALQYSEIGDYKKALEIYRKNIVMAQTMNYEYEIRAILNNMGCIYETIGDFANMYDCYCKIPLSQKQWKHYYYEMLSLLELGKVQEINLVYHYKQNHNEKSIYYRMMYYLVKYSKTEDLKMLSHDFSRILNQNKDTLNKYETKSFYNTLFRLYEKTGQYKKASDIAKQLI